MKNGSGPQSHQIPCNTSLEVTSWVYPDFLSHTQKNSVWGKGYCTKIQPRGASETSVPNKYGNSCSSRKNNSAQRVGLVPGTLCVLVDGVHSWTGSWRKPESAGSSSSKLLQSPKLIFNWKKEQDFIDNSSLRRHKFLLCTGRCSSPVWEKIDNLKSVIDQPWSRGSSIVQLRGKRYSLCFALYFLLEVRSLNFKASL